MDINKKIFAQYAALKEQEKEIKALIADMQPEVLHEMKMLSVEKVYCESGLFTISKRKEWKYSEDIDVIKKSLDTQKKFEEQTGVASYTESESLRFTSTQDELAEA